MNPFTCDTPPKKGEFVGREQEIYLIKQVLQAKNNVVLYGYRRYGITALIQEVFSHHMPDDVICVYVDLFDIVDEGDFAQTLCSAVADSLPGNIEEKRTLFKVYFSPIFGNDAKPSIKGDGSITIKTIARERKIDEILEGTLNGISKLCQSKGYSHAVFAFEEFQQVAEISSLKIDAKLRKHSQNNTEVCFLFSGSKRGLLRSLLSESNRPFYGMTTPVTLTGIDRNVLKPHCESKLKKQFDDNAFDMLYDTFRGQTKLILQACFFLYSVKEKVISTAIALDVIKNMCAMRDDEFRNLIITANQRTKKAFKVVALSGGAKPYSKDILSEVGINKQNLHNEISKLIKNNTLINEGDERVLMEDVLLELWLCSYYK